MALNELTRLYLASHMPAKAERFHIRAIVIAEEALGQEHPVLADLYQNYSTFLEKIGRHQDANKMSERAKAIKIK